MLNGAKIRAAKTRAKAYKLTDSHRLYLLVKPGGSKLWKWSYAYDGRQRTMHFGMYPIVSLLDARAKRDEARGQLADGLDPIVEKKLKIEANIEASRNTFERVAREWHEVCALHGRPFMPMTCCVASNATSFPQSGRCPYQR